ncbi:MAG: WD40 repeat domain-containing protein [Chloroflexota bacterium]
MQDFLPTPTNAPTLTPKIIVVTATPDSTETSIKPTQTHTPLPSPTNTPTATLIPTTTHTPGASLQNIQEVVQTFENHIGMVTSLAWSPDGKTLATGDGMAMIYFWDIETGYQVASIEAYPEGGGAGNILWSPVNNWIAASLPDYKVHVWDPDSREEILTTEEHLTRIESMDLSPDGSTIAAGDSTGILALWDANTGKYLSGIDGRDFFFSTNDLHWHPDGEHIAWGGLDGNVWLWDLEEEFDTLKKHTSSVYAIDFSPAGDQICSGDLDNMMYIWDVEEKEVAKTLEGHPGGVTSIAWSPDGQIIASSDAAGNILLWKAETGEIVRWLSHDGYVEEVAWSPDGRFLASAGDDGVVRVWGK